MKAEPNHKGDVDTFNVRTATASRVGTGYWLPLAGLRAGLKRYESHRSGCATSPTRPVLNNAQPNHQRLFNRIRPSLKRLKLFLFQAIEGIQHLIGSNFSGQPIQINAEQTLRIKLRTITAHIDGIHLPTRQMTNHLIRTLKGLILVQQ